MQGAPFGRPGPKGRRWHRRVRLRRGNDRRPGLRATRPRPTAYGYDQAGYSANGQTGGNGHAGGYGDSERGGTGAFPAGYAATSASGAGAYPEGQGANGYAANGYGSNGYGTSEYQANGYAANGNGAGDYPTGEPGGRGSAPSGAYQDLLGELDTRPSYANGTPPVNGSANGTAACASNAVLEVHPGSTANGVG